MKTILMAATVALFTMVSCNSDTAEEKYIPKDDKGVPITLNSGSKDSGQTTLPANPVQMVQPVMQPGLPGNNQPVSVGNTVITQTPATTVPTVTAPGMNPPHGQPGHRCDIAVGAPLNSKPTTAPVVAQQPAQQVVMTQQPTKPTPPGMNPPHGQPGHRCDIAVGAPLNSKPVATPVPVPAQQVNVEPVKKDSGQ